MASLKNSAMVYWIERQSGSLNSITLSTSDIPSGSYDAEVRIKHARDALEVVVFPLVSFGNDWAVAERARLMALSEKLMAEKAGA